MDAYQGRKAGRHVLYALLEVDVNEEKPLS
jgi:hypothetical protein